MFKNAKFFVIKSQADLTPLVLAGAAGECLYSECPKAAESSSGFVPPMGPGSDLAEPIGEFTLLKHAVEKRPVPKAEVERHAKRAAEEIERTTGRRPGRKEMRELKEIATASLRTQAFSRITTVPLAVSRRGATSEDGSCDFLLVVGTASSAQCDAIITDLIGCLPDVTIQALDAAESVSVLPLLRDLVQNPDDFTEIEFTRAALKLCDQSEGGKRTISYRNAAATEVELQDRLREGMTVVELGVSTQELSCILTEDLTMKAIDVEVVADDQQSADQSAALIELSAIKTALHEILAACKEIQ